MTVLTPVNANNIQNQLLLKQLRGFFESKVNKQSAVLLGRFNAQLNTVSREAEPWRAFKEDLVEPLRQVNRLVSRLESIRKTLDSLLKTLNTASTDPEADANASGYAAAFDSQLKSIRGYAESTFDLPNLLGKDEQARLSFPITPTGNVTQTINGTYAGTDYHIVDENGNRWQPERKTKLLVEYVSYPETEGDTKVALETGAKLDAFDSETDAITFTVNSATAAVETIDGTVVREGLGVLDSWLYAGLASQGDRDRALADIEAAKDIVDLEIRRYKVAATVVQFHSERAETNIGALDKQRDALLFERGKELSDGKDALDRQFSIAQQALISNINFQKNYALFFKADQNNTQALRNAAFFQKLIDIKT